MSSIAEVRLPVTRRAFTKALGLILVTGFTAIADELARLFRWCSHEAGPALVGAGYPTG
jgi:hypothetical protein